MQRRRLASTRAVVGWAPELGSVGPLWATPAAGAPPRALRTMCLGSRDGTSLGHQRTRADERSERAISLHQCIDSNSNAAEKTKYTVHVATFIRST
eukprot:4412299-Prymnesium_polylepis.2